jgi:hypothetical protein
MRQSNADVDRPGGLLAGYMPKPGPVAHSLHPSTCTYHCRCYFCKCRGCARRAQDVALLQLAQLVLHACSNTHHQQLSEQWNVKKPNRPSPLEAADVARLPRHNPRIPVYGLSPLPCTPKLVDNPPSIAAKSCSTMRSQIKGFGHHTARNAHSSVACSSTMHSMAQRAGSRLAQQAMCRPLAFNLPAVVTRRQLADGAGAVCFLHANKTRLCCWCCENQQPRGMTLLILAFRHLPTLHHHHNLALAQSRQHKLM